MEKFRCCFFAVIFLVISFSCKSPDRNVSKYFPVIEWGFPVGDEYLHAYVGTFCYSITYQENDIDYLVGYNHFLHSIDILDLTNKVPYKQILLDKEGANGVGQLTGIGYFKDLLVVSTNSHYHCLDMEGKISSSIEKSKIYDSFDGYGWIKPGLNMYWMMYNFFSFNNEKGEVGITLYPHKENTSVDAKVIVLSCINWEVVDVLDIQYPVDIKKEGNMGVLNSINTLLYKDHIFYNFPSSSAVYSFNRNNRTLHIFDVPSTAVKSFMTLEDKDDPDSSLHMGYYFPLQYDSYRNCFWRIQMGKKSVPYGWWTERPYSVSQLSMDMEIINEFTIPEDLGLYCNILIFKEGVLLPYMEGLTEDDIYFYFIPIENGDNE